MADKTVVTIRTKLNKDDKNPQVTVVTYNWAGCTLDMLKGPATDSLSINLQGGWRRSKKIPSTVEVNVSDMIARMGSRSSGPVTVDSTLAQAKALNPQELEKLIETLKAEDKARKDAERAAAKPAPKGNKSKDGEALPKQ